MQKSKKITRIGKGRSIVAYPDRYVVVDIETTGLSTRENSILEISALRYVDHTLVDTFSTLVHPYEPISAFITELTGITNEMVQDAPDIAECIDAFYAFVQDDVLVGYNVNFDVNFLYDNLKVCSNKILQNDYIDVLRIAKRVLPYLPHHKQTDIASYYGIDIQGAHRAEKDCLICHACLEALLQDVQKNESIQSFCQSFR